MLISVPLEMPLNAIGVANLLPLALISIGVDGEPSNWALFGFNVVYHIPYFGVWVLENEVAFQTT